MCHSPPEEVLENAMRRSGAMEKHNKGGDADKQPAGRISRLLRSGVFRVRQRRQMGRHSVLSQICLSLCLPKYSILIPSASPQLCHCCARPYDHYASIHPSSIHTLTQLRLSRVSVKQADPGRPASIIASFRACPSALQYLRVGLVVLAVVGGGIGGVWSRGCSCRAVGEGAGALGDDGRDGGAVHPGASLPSLGFTPHCP